MASLLQPWSLGQVVRGVVEKGIPPKPKEAALPPEKPFNSLEKSIPKPKEVTLPPDKPSWNEQPPPPLKAREFVPWLAGCTGVDVREEDGSVSDPGGDERGRGDDSHCARFTGVSDREDRGLLLLPSSAIASSEGRR